jgi:AAA family ATP:ADP antiporter
VTNWIHTRESVGGGHVEHEPLKGAGGFQLVLRQPYLLLIALLIVLCNLVNTTGEFILGKSVAEYAESAAASGEVTKEEYIGKFYADFYFWVNFAGAALQIFAVSRIMRRVGIGPALLFLPLIAMGGYALMAVFPMLGLIRAVKIAENGANYSLQNTARHALFLRTSREAKYKGKTAIDGFFWRAGDALSGLIVFLGTTLALDLRDFARTNTILTVAWLCVSAAIVWLRLRNGESEFEDAGPGADSSGNA